MAWRQRNVFNICIGQKFAITTCFPLLQIYALTNGFVYQDMTDKYNNKMAIPFVNHYLPLAAGSFLKVKVNIIIMDVFISVVLQDVFISSNW